MILAIRASRSWRIVRSLSGGSHRGLANVDLVVVLSATPAQLVDIRSDVLEPYGRFGANILDLSEVLS